MPSFFDDFAKLFTGGKKPARKPPPKRGGKGGALAAYQRTYGDKDGQTVFDAAQIKAKRKGKR